MKKILVCVDGSDYSKVCCQYAIWLSQQTQATIEVVYVSDLRQFEMSLISDFSASIGIQPYAGFHNQLKMIETEKVKTMKIFIKDIFAKANMLDKMTFHNKSGVFVEYLEEIDDHFDNVDLVLLGKRGESADSAQQHLGSSMDRVIRSTPKPCFICPKELVDPKKILFAYDGSPSCNKVIDFLVANKGFKNLELNILTVVDEHHPEKMRSYAESAQKTLKLAGYDPILRIVPGNPENVIVSCVEKENIDFLIAGAHGHSRIRDLILGSTTVHLLQRCKIPILMLR